jgi:hypothetical protein
LVGLVDSGSLPTLAWLSLSYATQHMRAHKSIFEFAKSSRFDCYFSLAILDNYTLQNDYRGIILLLHPNFIRKQFQ